MPKQIFKLQRPLAGNPVAMVYNKKRNEEYHFNLNKIVEDFMGKEYKIFVFGKFNHKSDLFEIDSVAPWQDW